MKTKLLILIMTALALGACAKKSSKSSTRTTRGGQPVIGGALPPAQGSPSCGVTANMWGRIYDNNVSGYEFTQRLISFTNNPDIDYVESRYMQNAQTGVDLQMTARFVNGQFDAGNSRFLIRIIDQKSYTQGLLADIPLQAASGSVGGNGSFTATFRDQLGSVTVQGYRTSQNMIEGTINFQNGNSPAQMLGRIYLPPCMVVGI
ncbi:MAG: hypothetical protein ACK5Y2_03210 [Bdellovibrionales bacterium]